jgi:two-component sensor histidine kinase
MAYEVLHVVNELVTNAVLHTTGPVTLALDLRGPVVRIVVDDESKALPAEGTPGLTSTRGRGLLIVAALARTWGVRDRDGGKTVWADVDLRRGDPLEDPHPAATAQPESRKRSSNGVTSAPPVLRIVE